jgi:hypothetical protein
MSIDRVFPQAMRRLVQTAEKRGVNFPAKIRKEIDDDLALIDKADKFDFANGPSMSDVVLAAIREDRDPLADPEVIRIVARDAINQRTNFGTITQSATERLHATVISNLDEIVDQFKPVFNTAGAKLAAAYEVLTAAGFKALDDQGIMTAPMSVAKANVEAREAIETISAITQALALVYTCTGSANPTPVGRVVQIADIEDTPAMSIARTRSGHMSPWEIVAAGFTLSLANPTDTDARAQHAYEVEELRTLAAAKADRDYIRDHQPW